MGPMLENLKDVPEKFGDLGGFLVSEEDYDVSIYTKCVKNQPCDVIKMSHMPESYKFEV